MAGETNFKWHSPSLIWSGKIGNDMHIKKVCVTVPFIKD